MKRLNIRHFGICMCVCVCACSPLQTIERASHSHTNTVKEGERETLLAVPAVNLFAVYRYTRMTGLSLSQALLSTQTRLSATAFAPSPADN